MEFDSDCRVTTLDREREGRGLGLITNREAACFVVGSMECTEGERLAAEKRDAVKTKVSEINEKLSEITNKKKEKMKDAKKTRKYVVTVCIGVE